jgi:hypothetical protein
MVLGIASEEVQDEMYKAKGILPLVEILSHTQNSALLVESAQLLAILARNRMSKRWQCGAHQVLTDHICWCACCRMDTPFNRWPIVCYRTIGRDAYSRRGRGVYRCCVAAADKSTFKRYVLVRHHCASVVCKQAGYTDKQHQWRSDKNRNLFREAGGLSVLKMLMNEQKYESQSAETMIVQQTCTKYAWWWLIYVAVPRS